MPDFVHHNSIVRKIWGRADMILFIFAGASAEFALNKAVDWLYFTGKLPADPLGRLFSTVSYAQGIVFASLEEAHRTIDTIRKIHGSVEMARGMAIPDWAYRDVLFMLIHYSIAAHELFDRKLSEAEKAEVYDVFYRVGKRMGLKELPASYPDWLPAREAHLHQDLQYSHFTADLHKQYKKHLGPLRFRILKEGQKVVVPAHVQKLLRLHGLPLLRPLLPAWRLARKLHIAPLLLSRLLPKPYRPQLKLLIVSN